MICKPYTQWEDWLHGMYRNTCPEESQSLIDKSVELLQDCNSLALAMAAVCEQWTNSASTNLLGGMQNHRSWLGQAACCFSHGANEECTRAAWCRLTASEQVAANQAADMAFWNFMVNARGGQLMLAFE
jgi:hypothetical protein